MIHRKDGIVKREIAGETFLVPVTGAIASLKRVFILNEVAGFVWDRLEQPAGADDLAAAVVEAFDVGPAVARADVDELLRTLGENGLVGPAA